MRTSKAVLLALCSGLLLLQAGCCLCEPAPSGSHHLACDAHPEPPFDLEVKPPGPGLVFGTADFNPSTGTVLIKIQVQDLATEEGNQATITAWSGNGSPPADAASFPPDSAAYYATGGDVTLPHWTSHLMRDFEPATDAYWVAARVNHLHPDGSRHPRYVFWTWTPSGSSSPDPVRNFEEY